MSTARDLIRYSLIEIGVLASGETPPAQDQTDALAMLNRMIDSWSNESLLVYNRIEEDFPFVPSKQTYTMGSGGDFDTIRPQEIENVLLKVLTGDTFDLHIRIYNQDQWADITLKNTASTLPNVVYPDNSFPLMKLNFWPIPTQAHVVKIFSWKPLDKFASPNAELILPPGYEEAIISNLAARLAPGYGKQLDPVTASLAASSREMIKRMNVRPYYLKQDDALMQRRNLFDIRTGWLR